VTGAFDAAAVIFKLCARREILMLGLEKTGEFQKPVAKTAGEKRKQVN